MPKTKKETQTGLQRALAGLVIRRALLSVSDKDGIVELARALATAGAELIATGQTRKALMEAGLKVTPIEAISGSPEAFQGRMKTLSFPVCSGILYRRGDERDEEDLKNFKIQPIDCVVVNFYPFQNASKKSGISREDLIEQIDIGGPTLVRAAAKNSPDVLVLTSPAQYPQIVSELRTQGRVQSQTAHQCAALAWKEVFRYDEAIFKKFGAESEKPAKRVLKYGENPHQKASLEFDPEGPIAWGDSLTPAELSYNNILDVSAAYLLASDLTQNFPDFTGVVIVKHNNPCGVALVPKVARHFGQMAEQTAQKTAQKTAMIRAWEGDPISSFGGVVVFTDPLPESILSEGPESPKLDAETVVWLSQHFVELVAAPGLKKSSSALEILLQKRKNLKAISIQSFGGAPLESVTVVPGGRLYQTSDFPAASEIGTPRAEELRCVTTTPWPSEKNRLAQFGISVCQSLKSNAIALVRELHGAGVEGTLQLVGAGQGQPNRIDSLSALALPRARRVLQASATQGSLKDCVLVSDAFFPFRDTVDAAHAAGIRWIVQPGGSLKDSESIAACDEYGISMVFTGRRHFKH